MASLVTAQNGNDLEPFDMVEEGVFIKELRGVGSAPGAWTVAPCCYVEEPIGPEGEMVKRPVWGEPIDMPMSFPMTVARGAHLPRCQDGG